MRRRTPHFAVPVLAALCSAILVPITPATALPKTLRIATEGAYPPFNYAEGDPPEPAGFEVDLGRALCTAMKVQCFFVLQDWDTMISSLKSEKFDAIMSSMEITDERLKRISFSKPYYRIPSALITTKGNTAEGGAPETLAGHSVGVTANSEFQSFLEESRKDVAVHTYDKLEEATLDLLTGRIDYVLGDKLELTRFLEGREGAVCCRFVANLPVDRGGGVGVGLRKGDGELLDAFNKAIDAVMADGTYDRIRAKYFSFDIK